MNTEKLRTFALDLNCVAPRSPSAALDDFPVWAARLVDKCRAELLGQAGSYRFNCPMDRRFLEAAGLSAELVQNFVATGADDREVAAWMAAQAKAPREDFLRWCRRFQANPLWRFLELEDWLHRRGSARKQTQEFGALGAFTHPNEEQSSIQNDEWHRLQDRAEHF